MYLSLVIFIQLLSIERLCRTCNTVLFRRACGSSSVPDESVKWWCQFKKSTTYLFAALVKTEAIITRKPDMGHIVYLHMLSKGWLVHLLLLYCHWTCSTGHYFPQAGCSCTFIGVCFRLLCSLQGYAVYSLHVSYSARYWLLGASYLVISIVVVHVWLFLRFLGSIKRLTTQKWLAIWD